MENRLIHTGGAIGLKMENKKQKKNYLLTKGEIVKRGTSKSEEAKSLADR